MLEGEGKNREGRGRPCGSGRQHRAQCLSTLLSGMDRREVQRCQTGSWRSWEETKGPAGSTPIHGGMRQCVRNIEREVKEFHSSEANCIILRSSGLCAHLTKRCYMFVKALSLLQHTALSNGSADHLRCFSETLASALCCVSRVICLSTLPGLVPCTIPTASIQSNQMQQVGTAPTGCLCRWMPYSL